MKDSDIQIHKEGFTWKDSAVAVMILGSVLCQIAGLLALPINALSESIYSPVIVSALMYSSFITWWAVLFLFCYFVKKYNFVLSTFVSGLKGNTLKMLLCGLGIGFVINGICVLGAYLHKDIYLYFGSFKFLSLLLVFVCVFIQASAEELMYRGWMYQALRKGYTSPWVAIIINSLSFSMGHLLNPGMTVFSFINIFLAGLLFSLLVYRFDSLWAAIGAHTAWNYTQNVIFGLPNSGVVLDFSLFKLDASKATDSFFYNVAFGIEGSLMATLVLTITCVLIYVAKKWVRES